MKTIIIYASKHGAAVTIAQRIAEKIRDAVIHNLKQGAPDNLAGYDCVIIGSSVYAGKIRAEAKKFVFQNEKLLLEKKTGLFLSCMETKNANTYFETNFPAEILRTAKARCAPGGIFDPKKAGPVERLIIKMIKKSDTYYSNIDDREIDHFSGVMISETSAKAKGNAAR